MIAALTKRCLFPALTTAILVAAPMEALATTTHEASAVFVNSQDPALVPNNIDRKSADAPGSTSPVAIQANVSGIGYSALAYVEPGGALAMEGSMFTSAELSTSVRIQDDEVSHPTGQRFRAVANVIVDGGFIEMIDSSPGAIMEFVLVTQAKIYDGFGNFYLPPFPSALPPNLYQSTAKIEYGPLGSATATISGHDIGMSVDPSGMRIDIPTSFQTYDFGVVPRNGYIDIQYYALVFANTNPGGGASGAFTEGGRWRFSDPLTVNTGVSPLSISMIAVPPSVPLPAGAPLLISALLTIGALARRRRHS